MRILNILEQLVGADDWRGVAAQERAAKMMPFITTISHCLRFVCF
jgi:hypothetical protein